MVMPMAGSRQAKFFDPLDRDVSAMNGVPTVHQQFIQVGVIASVDGRQLAQDVSAGPSFQIRANLSTLHVSRVRC
jgi:hypothetical protein